jgi:hypothetical protein
LTAMRSLLPQPPQQPVPYCSLQSVLLWHRENSLLRRSTA